jgi:putative acetyltransferase
MQIRVDDLSGEATRALVHLHVNGMQALPGPSFALDLSGLTAPDMTFWTAWDGDQLLGMAALKEFGPGWGEVKSMRTHPKHLRKGVAAALLDHILAEAKARGMRRLSLETGAGPAFEPAVALYRKRGFTRGAAFGDYPETDFNHCYHLELA